MKHGRREPRAHIAAAATAFEPQRGRHGRGRRGTPAITGRLAALHVLERAFGDDGAAVAYGAGPDLDEVVGLAQDPDVVVDDDLRVAVREQAADYVEEAVEVGGVQADRGLAQDVQDTRGPVADRAGQRDAPAFSGGQRGRGAVEGEVAQAVRRAAGRWRPSGNRCSRHGSHRPRLGGGDHLHPRGDVVEDLGGDVGEIDAVDEAGAGLLAQPGAVAIWRALR